MLLLKKMSVPFFKLESDITFNQFLAQNVKQTPNLPRKIFMMLNMRALSGETALCMYIVQIVLICLAIPR